jgi:hypothetical protein
VLRPLYVALCGVYIALGFVGLVVPGMPSTVFFLIALWAAERSSPEVEEWLLKRSPAGPILKDWRADRSMTVRPKIIATLAVWVTIGISILIVKRVEVNILLGVVAVALTVFFAMVKSKRSEPES